MQTSNCLKNLNDDLYVLFFDEILTGVSTEYEILTVSELHVS